MKEEFMNCTIQKDKQLLKMENFQIKQNFSLKFTHKFYYFYPTNLQVKLLDLNVNQVHPKFAFRSSDKLDINSDEASREIIIDKFRVFFLDCHEKQIKYLISQGLEKYYSNINVCHYSIRVLPFAYDPQTSFDLQPVARYDYLNSLAQTENYGCIWIGENNKSEILFIKPHLMEKAFYIIHTEHKCSYTTMNVTNWVHPHQVAIWVNCNDGSTKPSIFTFDLRNYYNGQNWLPEPQFTPTLARDEYIDDEPSSFMDIYRFDLDTTHVIQIRQVGNEAKISIINYQNVQKPEVINEVIFKSFLIDISVDHSYIIHYNDMSLDEQTLKFSILFPADERHQLLQIIEKTNIIEKQEKIFEFYQ